MWGDVAEVQDRLRRIQAGVVGVLVSATGFAKTAVAEAEGRRELPVLLLDLADLENVLEGHQELAALLQASAAPLDRVCVELTSGDVTCKLPAPRGA